MISGTNNSQTPSAVLTRTGPVHGNVSTTDVLQDLKSRRNNVLAGKINCIPFPFKRFSESIPGVEQEQYVVITASTKAGKTMLTSYLYLYNVLEYCFNNPTQCDCHIIYFALEESPMRIIQRYMSHLLWKLDGMRLAPTDLRSTSIDYPVPQEALDLLNSKPYQDRLRFFEEHVQFETENTNPTGIRNVCIEYAKSVGTLVTRKIKSKSDPGKEVEVFDSYTPNNPNLYKIMIVDHMSLVDQEKGFTTKQTMDKISEYCVKYLRNRFKFTCVMVQQQNFEQEGLDAIKQKHMMPTLAGLADSKYSSRDANVVVGLFSPNKFGIPSWLGYDITKLGNYARFVKILAARDGEADLSYAFFFDGAVCDFQELPRPDEVDALAPFYLEAESRKTYRQQRKLLSLGAMISLILVNMEKNNNYKLSK